MELKESKAWHRRGSIGKRKLALHVYVLSLGSVDPINRCFHSRLEVQLHWDMDEDDEHALNWFPRIYAWNVSEATVEAFLQGNGKNYVIKNKKVTSYWYINATFSETLELQNFPLDCQHLEAILQIRDDHDDPKNKNTAEIDSENSKVVIFPRLFSSSDMIMHSVEVRIPYRREIHIRYKFYRAWHFYFYKFIVVLALISLLAVATFCWGVDIANQLSYVSTLILAEVAFIFVISGYIPALPYVTLLDRYVFFQLLLTVLIGVEVFVTSQDPDNEMLPHRFLIADFVFWAIAHIAFGIYAVIVRRREWAKLTKTKEEVAGLDIDATFGDVLGVCEFPFKHLGNGLFVLTTLEEAVVKKSN